MIRSLLILSMILFLIAISGQSWADVPLEKTPFWQSYETGVYSTGMIWRDCNLDGFIDVLYSNGNDMALARNTLYLSDSGSLPSSASYLSGNYEYSGHCAVGDIDDDGYPDWIVANYLGQGRFSTAGQSEIYMNSPSGFPPLSDWITQDSIFSFSCALGDIDSDGDLDLAFATGEAYTAQFQKDLIYINNGTQFPTTPDWKSRDLTTAYDVTWGDVDNDGDLDLALCYESYPTSVFFNQDGVLDTVPGWQANQSLSGNTLIFGDVNSDGWLDLVVAYNSQLATGGYFRVYFNDGTGLLYNAPGWQSATGGYGSAVAMYDYDGDGDEDLAAGRWFDRPRVYENTGTTFTTLPVWRANLETVVEELAWVDVGGEGVLEYSDVIAADSDRRLFYTNRHPLHAIDSVVVDDVTLTNSQYCYDLISGWISLGLTPSESITVYYQYSSRCDLAVANWGEVNDVYGNINGCCGLYVEGFSGNVDCSPDAKRNLADITLLIDRIYVSKTTLCCEENGNIDGDLEAKLNLADITRLIDHVYVSKEETAPCL